MEYWKRCTRKTRSDRMYGHKEKSKMVWARTSNNPQNNGPRKSRFAYLLPKEVTRRGRPAPLSAKEEIEGDRGLWDGD